ncbi:MAG: hypothetical protein H6822_11405 [Planctomycetaceae bacterium]|nr:hypothetical protein [Planctomycetales bacterium]MCB9922781.1 hypothetical protein [Planctomycetaceae bacterium]
MRSLASKSFVFVLAFLLPNCTPAFGQLEYERDPINYSATAPQDRVARLKEQLDDGKVDLDYDVTHGYLPALMEYLQIPTSSQTLVFSKTSLQRHRISPRSPRAIYFDDDVYLGWVQQGDVIEISAVDPQLGAVFYTLDQNNASSAVIKRQTDHCLLCHASSHTQRIPGHIMRSVYSDASGLPVFSSGTYRTDDTSPFAERWGGWYVTGLHGRLRHMGNAIVEGRISPEDLDREIGANITDLTDRIPTSRYITQDSDIVALMVLGHQVSVHNQLAAANFQGRTTERDSEAMNRALERPVDFESDSTRSRYASAAEKLVEAILMVDEYEFSDTISGTSSFAKDFEVRGPFDTQGRSLRQFDLKRRLFRYPCSFLIYSDAFDGLPKRIRQQVYSRLWEILTGADQSQQFAHLTTTDRRAILEILDETKQDLSQSWNSRKK